MTGIEPVELHNADGHFVRGRKHFHRIIQYRHMNRRLRRGCPGPVGCTGQPKVLRLSEFEDLRTPRLDPLRVHNATPTATWLGANCLIDDVRIPKHRGAVNRVGCMGLEVDRLPRSHGYLNLVVARFGDEAWTAGRAVTRSERLQ